MGVVFLKDLAKDRGLTGYSKLRKAELRRLRSDLLNPKFGRQKSTLLCLKSHNFSET